MALPGILLGVGLGGFVDGIVVHQILQWHHMRSGDGAAGEEPLTTVGGLESNTLADGLFHVLAWAFVVAGVVALWRRARAGAGVGPARVLAGWIVAGWGLFNLVEGVVDHHVLRVHHVRDDIGGPLSWDLGFLALSAVLVVAGWAMTRGRGSHP